MFPLYSDNTLTRWPVATVLLILANIAMYIHQLMYPGGFEASVLHYGVIPAGVFHPSMLAVEGRPAVWITFASGMFSHGGLFHLFSNMLYLWVFGRDVENDFGFLPFLAFYLGTGLLSTLAFVFAFPAANIPLVGASGAIAGLLGAYFLRFPARKIYTLFILIIFVRIIPIPAFFMLGYWFLIQFLSCVTSCTAGAAGQGGVAWLAHIGGFVSGMIWRIPSFSATGTIAAMPDKPPHAIIAPSVTVMKSKFTGVLFHVESETAARESVKALKSSERKARHVVFAFRIEGNPVAEGMSDDGEPRGTGGLPILQMLRHDNHTNILVAVVRHYGGVKLGPGNLRRAYATAAKAAIESAGATRNASAV